MQGQLFRYYIENPMMIISINNGNWEGNCYYASYRFGGIGKSDTTKRRQEKGWMVEEEL
jgi:hypothetical protein